jgi:hypothetical protein
MSRYIVLNGQSRNSLNINAVKRISSPLGRQQWLNLFAKNPRILTRKDRVVILNNKSSSLTFRFNVSLYGNYDIFVRCIAPSTSTNTAIVKLDNSRAKILDLARRPRQYVFRQVTVKMFSNIALNAGVHKITFGYKEPIGLIRLFVQKKNSNVPPIVIPSIDVALNPNNIYTEPVEQPPTELIPPEPIIDVEEPIDDAEEPVDDVITPVEEIDSETPSPEPIYEIVSPEPIYETPSPEPIYETTSPKPVAKKATASKTESEKEEPMATWKIVLIVIFSIIILAIIGYFIYRYYSRRRKTQDKTFDVVKPTLQGKSRRQFEKTLDKTFDVVKPTLQEQFKTQDKTFDVVNQMFQGKFKQQFDADKKQLSEQDLYQSYRNLFKQYQQKLSEQEMFQSFRNLMQEKEQPPEIARKLKNVKTFPTRTGFLNLAQILANAEKRNLKKTAQAPTKPIQINFSPEINVNTAQQKEKTFAGLSRQQFEKLKNKEKSEKQKQQLSKAIDDRIKIQNRANPNVLKALTQYYKKDKPTPKMSANIKALKKDQQQQFFDALSQQPQQSKSQPQSKPKPDLLAGIKNVVLKPVPKPEQKKEQKGSNLLEQLTKKIGGRRVSPVYVSQEDLKKPKTKEQAPLKLDKPIVLSKQQRDKLKRRAAATTYQRQDQDQDQQWLD